MLPVSPGLASVRDGGRQPHQANGVRCPNAVAEYHQPSFTPGPEERGVGIEQFQHGSRLREGSELGLDGLGHIGVPLPLQVVVIGRKVFVAASRVAHAQFLQ